ncbi:MAG: hypothetical protein JXR63_02980 [Spirochaetales bacterium]|nr:hypothetical protein [Spirochaetales bacterium]
MKKLLSVLLVMAVLFTAVSCNKESEGDADSSSRSVEYTGKYADAYVAMVDVVDAMEDYADALDKVETADQLVAAIEKFQAKMEELTPVMDQLEAKYSGVEDFEDLEEFAALEARITEISTRIAETTAGLADIASDPAVIEAMMQLMVE